MGSMATAILLALKLAGLAPEMSWWVVPIPVAAYGLVVGGFKLLAAVGRHVPRIGP